MRYKELIEAPRRNIPANVPPEAHYRNSDYVPLRMQATQPHQSDWDNLAQYISPERNENEGTYLRFDPTTGPSIKAYWTRNFTTNYGDAARMGNVANISNMQEFFALQAQLKKLYKIITVVVEPQDMANHPEFFSKLKFFAEKSGVKPDDLEFDFVAPKVAKPSAPIPGQPDAGTPFKETPQLQAAFVQFFRSHPALSQQLSRITTNLRANVRTEIMKVLHAFEGDEDEAVIDVATILNKATT